MKEMSPPTARTSQKTMGSPACHAMAPRVCGLARHDCRIRHREPKFSQRPQLPQHWRGYVRDRYHGVGRNPCAHHGRSGFVCWGCSQTDILAVITAVVIGGTPLFGGVGRIGGTLVGVAILGVLTNGLIMIGMKPYMQQVATGIFLLAALLANRFRETKRSTHRPNQGHPSKRRPRK